MKQQDREQVYAQKLVRARNFFFWSCEQPFYSSKFRFPYGFNKCFHSSSIRAEKFIFLKSQVVLVTI